MTVPSAKVIVSVDLVAAASRSEDIPPDLTADDLQRASDRYERFLLLCARYPSQELAPTHDIDLMWHLHMLHPRAYYNDCTRLFGKILDHDGGFGMSDDERPALEKTFAETAELWDSEFGEAYCESVSPKSCRSLKSCRSRLPG